MEYDEDATEWSIHDLDHAPEPPESHSPLSFRKPRSSSISTLPQASSDTLSPRSAVSRIRKGSLDLRWGSSSREMQAGGRNSSSSLSKSEPTLPYFPAARRRSKSQSDTFSSSSLASLNVAHVKSFPPDVNDASDDRKEGQASGISSMLYIPEEGKEEEVADPAVDEEEYPFPEIVLSGSEIDEVDRKNANKPTRSDSASGRWSDTDFALSEDAEEDTTVGGDEQSSVATTPAHKPVTFLGFKLPQWFSKRRISWNRVSIFVVNWAPCFLCIRMKHSTYRAVLVRLNIISAFFAAVQLGNAVWFYIIIQSQTLLDRELSDQTQEEIDFQSNFEVLTNVWTLNGSIWFLGIVAFVLLVAIVLTVRVIQNVNLAGAIRFLWVILWVLPLEIFWLIGLFDYFQVTEVWIKFWWRDLSMAWFRKQFCEPREGGESTANRECTVPVFEDVEDEREWCRKNYNGFDGCVEIREKAQDQMLGFALSFFYSQAGWAFCFVLLLFLVVKTLESIISKPLVQKSRENNVPSWLFLPIVGSLICGILYSFSTTSVLNTRSDARSEASWIGPLFITAGGLFFAAAVLAWFLGSFSILNTRGKRQKSIAIVVFIAISFCLLILLTTIFSASIAFTLSLEELPITDALRGDIACFIDQSGSCTNCDSDNSRCPEWSEDEVTRILQTQVKAGAALAGIFLIYAANCLQYGFTLWRHILNYEIEYV